MKKYFIPAVILMLIFSILWQPLKSQVAEKLNIVLFLADDLGVNDIQPYGNNFIRTPHLDRFSGQSLLFRNAFASSPTCGPSRSTIFTGLMPLRHGAHGNHAAVAAGTKSIVHYLQPLGYDVALAGKLHVGPEESFPFERIGKTNVAEPGFEKKPGLNYDLNMQPVDKWLSARKGSKPFMLVVADHSPHVVWPEKATYDPDKIDIPVKHIDTKETRISRARYYTDISKMDSNFGRLLMSLEKYGLEKNTLVIFTADQGPQWPFAKWSLYDDGVKVPLMIHWPGTVKQPGITDALVSLADLVPTIVEAAGGTATPAIDGKSFLAVLKGIAKIHREVVFATHTGDGMMNRAPARMLRTGRYKYILNLAPEILYTTHMDKAKDHDGGREYWDSWRNASFSDSHAAEILWRYHNRPAEELYDTWSDPHELRNLAADSNKRNLLTDFRKRLAGWRSQQYDTITGPEILPVLPAGQKPGKPLAPYVFLD